MELNSEAAHYVIRWYAARMTTVEKAAHKHLLMTMKVTGGRSDADAQHEAQKSRLAQPVFFSDPDVRSLARGGYEAFVQRTAARIVKEHGDKVFFNNCPQCGKLTRGPHAKQCRFCRLTWRNAG